MDPGTAPRKPSPGVATPRVLHPPGEPRRLGRPQPGRRRGQGAFVAFLDSDDEFLDCKLATFHAAILQAGPEAARTVWYSPLIFDRGQNNRMIKPERAIASGERVGTISSPMTE